MISHYSPLAGHSGQRRMYDTLRQTTYWTHMAADVDYIVKNCRCCVRNTLRYSHRPNLRRILASGPLELIAVDIIGPFLKTVQGSHYALVSTHRYSKLTQAVPTSRTTVTHVVTVLVYHWLIPYSISPYLLTDNGVRFVSESFATVCALIGVEHLTSKAHFPQTNKQAKQFNKIFLTSLRYYVTEHWKEWDTFLQQLTHSYKTQYHYSSKQRPFSLVPGSQPSVLTSLVSSSAFLPTAMQKRLCRYCDRD